MKRGNVLNLSQLRGNVSPAIAVTLLLLTLLLAPAAHNESTVSPPKPRKHIGSYNTKELAEKALNLYNETGKRMQSDKTIKINKIY